MKKLLTSTFMLCLFLLMAWGITGWFIGINAESTLKNYLSELEKTPGEKLFRAELLEFKKTISGAKARIKIASDTSFLNERLGDFELDARLLNGPVFIDSAIDVDSFKQLTFNTGITRWKITIDERSLEAEKAEYLQSLFPEGLPIAMVRTDFDNKAYYQSYLKTIYAVATLSGIYNLDNGDNHGSLLLDHIRYGISPQLLAEHASLHYQHQRSISTAYKPGTTHLKIKDLEVKHAVFTEPVKLNVSADIAIQSDTQLNKSNQEELDNNVLNGLIKINVEKIVGKQIPVDNADIKVQFDNIPTTGFIAISEQHAKQDNLRQQMQWTLEENGEFPEGQDHLWQLNDQLHRMQQQLPQQLAALFLKSNNSQVRFSATANENAQESKSSTLNGTVSLNNKRSKDNEIDDLLMAEAQIKLSNDLFNYLNPLLNSLLKTSLSTNAKPITPDFKLIYNKGVFSLNN